MATSELRSSGSTIPSMPSSVVGLSGSKGDNLTSNRSSTPTPRATWPPHRPAWREYFRSSPSPSASSPPRPSQRARAPAPAATPAGCAPGIAAVLLRCRPRRSMVKLERGGYIEIEFLGGGHIPTVLVQFFIAVCRVYYPTLIIERGRLHLRSKIL